MTQAPIDSAKTAGAASRTPEIEPLFEELADANHILARHRILDGFGHVSVRDPRDSGRFFISRSRAPEIVSPDDIMTLDLEGQPVDGDTRTRYLEIWIHSEVYKRRPDVQSIVHSHSPSVIPFGVSTVPLRPVFHMAGFLGSGTPVFDIGHCFGCTDMLVRNREQGAELANVLADADVALMRGHGFIATGPSLATAVYRAIYTEINADMQQKAIALGGNITYLDKGEAKNADNTNRGVIDRPWTLWRSQVRTDDQT